MQRCIGKGSNGTVFEAVDTLTSELVAVKIGFCYVSLSNEIRGYKAICGGFGFPALLSSGYYENKHYIAMSCLGPSIADLLKYSGGQFNGYTVRVLGAQTLDRLRAVHDKGFTHGSVKSANLCMGLGRRGRTLYLVDFGSVSRIDGRSPSINSSATWKSINRHNGERHCMRDDIESWFYCLLEWLEGGLPWNDSRTSNMQMAALKKMQGGAFSAQTRTRRGMEAYQRS